MLCLKYFQFILKINTSESCAQNYIFRIKKKRGRGDLLLNARALHHNKHQFLFTPYTWRRKKLGKVEDQSDRRPVIHLPGFSANQSLITNNFGCFHFLPLLHRLIEDLTSNSAAFSFRHLQREMISGGIDPPAHT